MTLDITKQARFNRHDDAEDYVRTRYERRKTNDLSDNHIETRTFHKIKSSKSDSYSTLPFFL